MKNTIIRVNATPDFPRALYVKNIGRDGGFGVTHDKEKARTFTADTATLAASALANPKLTFMTFTTCEVAQ